MWSRFLKSGWYEITVSTLFVAMMALLVYQYGPKVGTGIDALLGWIGGLPFEYQVLSGLALFILLIWAGVHQLSLLTKIER